MHFYIAGATGRNGSIALQTALSHGHTVTILARNPASVAAHPNLTVIKGTVTSQQDVQTALSTPVKPEVVITAINPRRTTESPFSPLSPDSPVDLLESTARILLAAIRKVFGSQDLPKIVVNSSLGVGSSWAYMPLPFKLIFRMSTMILTIRDHDNMDKLIRESGLPFVLARPARLTETPAKSVKVLPDNGKGLSWSAAIGRQDVGEWLVRAAESHEWDGRSPVLVN